MNSIEALDHIRQSRKASLREAVDLEPFDVRRVIELAEGFDGADIEHARAVMAELRDRAEDSA